MYSQIFFANLAEISLNLVHFMKPSEVDAEISEDHALCDRFIFSQNDDSILVTPYLIDRDFLTDSLKNLHFKNAVNLSPKKVGESLCKSVQQDKELYTKIISVIKENPGINLLSYSGTPEFFDLVDDLKRKNLKFTNSEIPLPQNRWAAQFFDSKAGFRQSYINSNRQIPTLAPGVICENETEIVGWARHFLKTSAGVVIKSNHGLAGAGLKIIRKGEVVGEAEKFVQQILKSEDYFQHGQIVVEQFIPPDLKICGGAPNIELQIKNKKIIPLYACSMRMSSDGVFQGVEFGANAVDNSLETKLVSAATIYGEKLISFGYNGFFELDFVAGTDGKIYPIESNLRRTGGTHAYELALKLLGKNALKQNYFVTNNRILTANFKNADYQKLKSKLSALLYPIKNKKEGLILTIISNLSRGRLGYVIIGKTKQRAFEIEADFQKLLN